MIDPRRDRLDDAIDAVAARLTHVDADPAMASRIVSALPERAAWFGWFHSWVPRLAMLVVIVIGGWLWSRAESVAPAIPRPFVARLEPIGTKPTLIAAAPLEPVRTKPVEPLEPLEPLERLEPDHEFSLPAIQAPAGLEVDSLAPVSMPEDAPLTLAPLAIADLPLTSETISPR